MNAADKMKLMKVSNQLAILRTALVEVANDVRKERDESEKDREAYQPTIAHLASAMGDIDNADKEIAKAIDV